MEPLIGLQQNDYVRRLILNRPDKLNAMTPDMENDLEDELNRAAADPDTRVVVLSGAGRAFCSGFDLQAMADVDLADGVLDLAHNQRRVQRWMRIRDLSIPLIAQVHGYCLGVANELVGCCDLVFCGTSARFGMPEVREFALPPTLAYWPTLLGPLRTKELLFTGRLIDGEEAARLGLANDVTEDDELEALVDVVAGQIATGRPGALAICKHAVNSWTDVHSTLAVGRGPALHALYHQVRTRDAHTTDGPR